MHMHTHTYTYIYISCTVWAAKHKMCYQYLIPTFRIIIYYLFLADKQNNNYVDRTMNVAFL